MSSKKKFRHKKWLEREAKREEIKKLLIPDASNVVESPKIMNKERKQNEL